MAQIVTITNPLTGQPAQVDQLDHTAQQIDDGIARALPGGAIDLALSTKPGQNLLDNSVFLPGCLVNQRGQTSYTGAVYGIDRWRNWHGTTTCIISDEGLYTVDTDNNIAWLTQIFERLLKAGTYTLSALFTSSEKSDTTRLNFYCEGIGDLVNAPDEADNLVYGTFTIQDTSAAKRMWVSINASNKGRMIAAKLELGDTQTLAHQDANGKWVLNELPDYGEQLRRCQRYFFRFSGDLFTHMMDTGMGYATAWLPVPMREAPTISRIIYADDHATPSAPSWSSSLTSVLFQSEGSFAQIRGFDANAEL